MNTITKFIKQSLKFPNRTANIINQVKYSSFTSSPFVVDLKPSVKYEVSKDPAEWTFVERLLPPATIPTPLQRAEYVSNWKPQSPEALNHPYFVKRTKNHMIPVYLETTYRGMRRITQIKFIEGDIWQLEKDLKKFLQPLQKKPIRTQVHEFAGYILVHGDHVNAIKHWLQEKQF